MVVCDATVNDRAVQKQFQEIPKARGRLHASALAPDNLDDPAKLRDTVQAVTLLALRAVGVMDARARGLVVQAVLPTRMLVGA